MERSNIDISSSKDKLRVSITEGKQERWFDITEETAWKIVDGLHRELIRVDELRRGTK